MRTPWEEDAPYSWPRAHDELLGELEQRKRAINEVLGLSPAGLAILVVLHRSGGRMFFEELFAGLMFTHAVEDGLAELLSRDLVASSWALDEHGSAVEPIVHLCGEKVL